MIDGGWSFVIAAYGAGILGLAALCGWTVLRLKRARKRDTGA
jgi:hypothetical protein